MTSSTCRFWASPKTLATIFSILGRASAEGRVARNELLLLSATFAALVVLLLVDSTGAVPLLASLPALLVAFLFALGAVRRGALLRSAGLLLGVLYALAGLLVSLAGAF